MFFSSLKRVLFKISKNRTFESVLTPGQSIAVNFYYPPRLDHHYLLLSPSSDSLVSQSGNVSALSEWEAIPSEPSISIYSLEAFLYLVYSWFL